jgi:tRNA pseudouridine38-40 synthase
MTTMPQRYRLLLEYHGAGFAGWQRQERRVRTAQGVVEQAIAQLTGEDVVLHAAGRTDAGVHALGQVAHVELQRTDITPAVLRDAVNFFVRPHPVTVLEAQAVSPDFHARFGAIGRRYHYRICNRRAPPMLAAGLAWHVIKPLDVAAMQTAATLLLGHHDFSTFRAQFCQATSPLRTLEEARFQVEGEMIIFTTRARSFLYHQVRNMIGTLVMVGTGKWSVADFAAAFAAHDRARGGPTAPPHGLYFAEVFYHPVRSSLTHPSPSNGQKNLCQQQSGQ